MFFENARKCYNIRMISQLTGLITEKALNYVVIDVHGVGYKVFVSGATLGALAGVKKDVPTTVFTYLAVRETALDLYGFADVEEKKFFELLLTISGIGPKSAIGILGSASVATIREGVLSEDYEYFSKISGIGKKTAEKIIVGLKDKIGAGDMAGASSSTDNAHLSTVMDALVSLGYSDKEVRGVMKKIKTEDKSDHQKIIKEALKILSGN